MPLFAWPPFVAALQIASPTNNQNNRVLSCVKKLSSLVEKKLERGGGRDTGSNVRRRNMSVMGTSRNRNLLPNCQGFNECRMETSLLNTETERVDLI